MYRPQQILTFDITDSSMQKIQKIFNKCYEDSTFIGKEIEIDVCTRGGVQTLNAIKFIDSSVISEITEIINQYIMQYYDGRLKYFDFFIDYIHFISYKNDGYQLGHTHYSTEDISFIVYLNDSDAVTRIYCENGCKEIKSVKNKLVIFDPSLYHEATKCSNERKVMVGAVRFLNKIWKNDRIV